jgi:putative PIN family toxin of toxin-antitoxin system
MAKSRVLVDTSVLIAALLSSRGGAFYVLQHLSQQLSFQINDYILRKVNINLNNKFLNQPSLKNRFFSIMAASKVAVLPNPSYEQLRVVAKVVNKKDAPILASALAESDCLLTLDNDFLAGKVVKHAEVQGLQILKPETLINLYRKELE